MWTQEDRTGALEHLRNKGSNDVSTFCVHLSLRALKSDLYLNVRGAGEPEMSSSNCESNYSIKGKLEVLEKEKTWALIADICLPVYSHGEYCLNIHNIA